MSRGSRWFYWGSIFTAVQGGPKYGNSTPQLHIFLGGIAHPLKVTFSVMGWWDEWVMESTAFHHVPVGGSWWNFNTTCVLVISCHPQRVEVIGQKVKGHGSKMRSFWGIFGFLKLQQLKQLQAIDVLCLQFSLILMLKITMIPLKTKKIKFGFLMFDLNCTPNPNATE